MGDRQGRLSAVNLCPFVGVDPNVTRHARVSRHMRGEIYSN